MTVQAYLNSTKQTENPVSRAHAHANITANRAETNRSNNYSPPLAHPTFSLPNLNKPGSIPLLRFTSQYIT